jgi:hypothetical protein
MCDADRDAYGGPEWIDFDREALRDLPGSKLMELEQATGFRLAGFFDDRIDTMHGMRARLYVARSMAGLVDDWAAFDPKVLQSDMRIPLPDPGDTGPPDGASGTGSEAAP